MKNLRQFILFCLENYNIGNILQISEISSGYANENYKLLTDEGVFLFRICKRQPLASMLFEMKLLDLLKKNNFKTAFVIKNKLNNHFLETNEGFVIVYQFISGSTPHVNQFTASEIAAELAKLHSIPTTELPHKQNFINIQRAFSLIEQHKTSEFQYNDIISDYETKLKWLQPKLNQQLPQGAIHADIFPDNTIFVGNKLAAIIDFEEACIDSFLFDIAMTINGFCYTNNTLNYKLLSVFLKEYQNIRKLTHQESELLPIYINWAAIGMVSWHLGELLKQRNEKQLERVKELLARVVVN